MLIELEIRIVQHQHYLYFYAVAAKIPDHVQKPQESASTFQHGKVAGPIIHIMQKK